MEETHNIPNISNLGTKSITNNNTNYIKCIYEIKKEDLGKDIQILNNKDPKSKIPQNGEIEKEIIIEINGQIKSNILTYKFNKAGTYNIRLISNHHITNMSYMFSGCSSLKEISFSSFNTNRVTYMSHLFSGCSSLKQINFSSFNTDQVTDMSYMFSGCSSLKQLNLSSFNTNQVNNMYYMFGGCSLLKEVNLTSFNTSQVII